MIQSFNNKTEKVGNDFKKNIGKDSRLQVAVASFKDDKDRINVEERFKRLLPETKVTVI